MRRFTFIAAALVAGTAFAAPMAQRIWEAAAPTAASMPTSQAFATNAVMYWNTVARGAPAKACAFEVETKQSACAMAGFGTFDHPWVPAAGAELHPMNSAFAFSSASELSATQYTDVLYHQASPTGGAGKIYTFQVTAESVVSLAPLNAFGVALRYARRAAAPGEYQDTIAIRSLATANFTVLWSETSRHTHSAAMPAEAEAIISMEGSTFMYLAQDGTSATLHARMANGTSQFAMAPPCGIDPRAGFVGIRKVSFQTLETGEVLQAAIISGRNATVPNGTIMCRVSHHSGQVKGTPVVFPNIQRVHSVSGGSGQIVVSGTDAAETTDTVGLFDATTGQLRWTTARPVADAGSSPAVHRGDVFFQSGGSLVSRGLSYGTVTQRANVSCTRMPAVTDSRIYCVQSGATPTLTAFAPMTNEIIWTTPVDWQYGAVAIPGSITDTVAVVTTTGSLVGFDTATQPLPAPPGEPGKSNAAVTAVIIVLVLVLIGVAVAAGWFYKTRGGFNMSRSRTALVNEAGDGPAETPKASHDLYGSAA